MRRILTVAVVGMWSALTLGAALADEPAKVSASAGSGSGEVFEVTSSSQVPSVAIGGSVVPYRKVTLSAQLPGRVKYVAGVEGDYFKEGSLLVALDDTELLANRAAAYAQYQSAQAQLSNAGVQYTRELWSPRTKDAPGGMGVPNLFDQMFTRPAENFFGERDRGAERAADLYDSTTRVEQARSAMLRAASEIQAIDAKLRDTKSVAPFDGVILHKYVEEGDTVQPGQPLLDFGDVTWLQIEVDLPARLAKGLKPMMILRKAGTSDDHPKPFDVRVAQVFPMADPQRHTVKVKFDIPQGVSKPGMYAKVQVPDTSQAAAETKRLPMIPTSAILYRGNLPVVYVQGINGEPELRMIREGRRLTNGMTEVLSGIAEGDRVFVHPGPTLLNEVKSEPAGEGDKKKQD